MIGNQTRSFNDVYRQIFKVNADLLADKIDAQKSMAFAANMKVMNEFINTEIKMHQLELASGNAIPLLGGRVISTDAECNEKSIIEGEAISDDSVKKLAAVAIDPEAQAKTRKPKLGFVGLSPTEAGSISAAYGEFADLLFWRDEGTPKLKPLCKCDVVFANLSQVSHKTTEYLLANGLSGNSLVKVTGGLSAMKFAVKARFESGGAKS